MPSEHLHSIFGVAHTDVRLQPFNNAGRTLRLVVEANVDAYALQVRFANYYGENTLQVGAASLALCDEQGLLEADTLIPLTVGGVLHFTLEPGQEVLSDTVRFALRPGQFVALNLYYPQEARVESGNWVSHTSQRSKPGNFSADLSLPGPGLVSRFARTVTLSDMTTTITTVAEIIAYRETPGRVIGCFGDSITQQGNWTVPLDKLLRHKYPGEVSLCNLGISGNRLLHDSAGSVGGLHGIAGVRRFARDVLVLHGLTHVILEIGTNDIGQPGAQGVPETELIHPADYFTTMQALADELHSRGIKAYAATLPPRPIAHPFDELREGLRQQMNDWLRTAPCFDAVLDFDAVLRRDDGKPGMREGCALPDGLHPSPYGGLWMAKSIDLSLFGGDEA